MSHFEVTLGRIDRLLQALIELVEQRTSHAVSIRFAAYLNGRWKEKLMALTMKDTEQVVISVTTLDAKGKPAPVQSPTWESSNPVVLALTPSADGMSCAAVAGDPGDARVTFTCDSDLGEGVKALAGTLDVTILPGEAVTVVLAAGLPASL